MKRIILGLILLISSCSPSYAGPSANVILGAIVVIIGGGFEVSRRDAASDKEHNLQLWSSHMQAAEVYLMDGFTFKGRADQELTINGDTPAYRDMKAQAREFISQSAVEQTMAYSQLGSSWQSGDRERLYKGISIACLTAGSLMIIYGVVAEHRKDSAIKAALRNIQIEPSPSLDGGKVALVRRF